MIAVISCALSNRRLHPHLEHFGAEVAVGAGQSQHQPREVEHAQLREILQSAIFSIVIGC